MKLFLKKNKWIITCVTLVILFLGLADYFYITPQISIPSTISLLGLLFISLKHKLDVANYNRELFTERYKIFEKIQSYLGQISNR